LAVGGIVINSHKIKVLLIEDSLDICRALKKYLDEQICFEVVGTAHNGADGLEALLNTPCDVALIDIIMPQKDGISVLEGLRNHPEVKRPACIMFTAVSHDGLTKKALELGADYFVLKPFDMDVLARRILDIHDHRMTLGEGHEKPTNSHLISLVVERYLMYLHSQS
jgi:two-component system response regulator (stage 0 sporulation protein A)